MTYNRCQHASMMERVPDLAHAQLNTFKEHKGTMTEEGEEFERETFTLHHRDLSTKSERRRTFVFYFLLHTDMPFLN